MAQLPLGNIISVYVIVIPHTPLQLSIAVAVPKLAGDKSASHSTVISGGVVNIGGVISSMVKVAEVVGALPQSSVAVKITVAEPVSPHKALYVVE